MITKILVTLGLLGCLIGFFTILVFEKRDLGGTIFQLGFYIAGIGAVLSVLMMKSEDIPHNLGESLKIAACGFGIIIVGYVVSNFFSIALDIGKYGFYLGLIIMLFGIIRGFFKYTQ